MSETPILEARGVNAGYGQGHAIRDVHMGFHDNKVTAIIGPSGCGKSTLIRCLNRMHEETPGTTVQGAILLSGENIFDMDPVLLRRRVGMVFQRPNPFPSMSIFSNVAAGLILNGLSGGKSLEEAVESSLRQAGLWEGG